MPSKTSHARRRPPVFRARPVLCSLAPLALLAALIGLAAAPAPGQEAHRQGKAGVDLTAAVPASSGSAGLETGGEEEQPAEVYVHVRVPRSKDATDNFTIYPYPVKPPRLMAAVQKLPTEDKILKGMLLEYGYTNRHGKHKRYIPHGWRFQYAYEAALRREGDLPHTMFDMYPWVHDMVRYIKPEIERINTLEAQRITGYATALHYYEKNYFDIQNEATRKGLFAVDLRMFRSGQGYAKLPAGQWWLAGTRKLPDLIYYWQIPVTLAPGQTQHVELNEPNALVIQGDW